MPIIEHLRHAMRQKPGPHLSQSGIDLARALGGTLGPFDLVVTSPVPRAAETAAAMGFAVDEEWEELASLPEGFEEEAAWNSGFAVIAQAARARPNGAVARYAQELASLHGQIAQRLSENGNALIISHGGVVETSAIGGAPNMDFTAWDFPCGFCEGVRLTFDGPVCQGAALARAKV